MWTIVDGKSPREIEGNARNAPRSTSILLDYSKGKSPPKRGLLSDMACLVSLELSIGGYASSDFVGIICTTSIAK